MEHNDDKTYFQLGVLKAAIQYIRMTAKLPGLSYNEIEQKLKSISHSAESAEGLIKESEKR